MAIEWNKMHYTIRLFPNTHEEGRKCAVNILVLLLVFGVLQVGSCSGPSVMNSRVSLVHALVGDRFG